MSSKLAATTTGTVRTTVKKYAYKKLFIIQGLFDNGKGKFIWEDVDAQEEQKAAKESVNNYRNNDVKHSYRIINRRVPRS